MNKEILVRNWRLFLCFFLFSLSNVYSDVGANTGKELKDNHCDSSSFQGWSFDIGGQYTWMLFNSPGTPKFSGSTGGAHGSITYQKSHSLFAQVRSYWNGGHLTASGRTAHEKEFYTDLLAGYCFSAYKHLMITPYLGLGFDFLTDHKSATAYVESIKLKYKLNYGILGLDVRYVYRKDWAFGGQVECFPTFEQNLSIEGLSGAAWKLKERVGWAVRLPTAYRLVYKIWLEVTPYYRYLPIGKSNVLDLPHRNLNEVGGLVTFRFFL